VVAAQRSGGAPLPHATSSAIAPTRQRNASLTRIRQPYYSRDAEGGYERVERNTFLSALDLPIVTRSARLS
jgi:hypothetical protein